MLLWRFHARVHLLRHFINPVSHIYNVYNVHVSTSSCGQKLKLIFLVQSWLLQYAWWLYLWLLQHAMWLWLWLLPGGYICGYCVVVIPVLWFCIQLSAGRMIERHKFSLVMSVAIAVCQVVMPLVIAVCRVVMSVVICSMPGGYTCGYCSSGFVCGYCLVVIPVVSFSAVCWAYDRATQVQLAGDTRMLWDLPDEERSNKWGKVDRLKLLSNSQYSV